MLCMQTLFQWVEVMVEVMVEVTLFYFYRFFLIIGLSAYCLNLRGPCHWNLVSARKMLLRMFDNFSLIVTYIIFLEQDCFSALFSQYSSCFLCVYVQWYHVQEVIFCVPHPSKPLKFVIPLKIFNMIDAQVTIVESHHLCLTKGYNNCQALSRISNL